MMTDRERLELAAKAASAAGMAIIDTEAGPQILERISSDGTECYRIWNPLTDDGDAQRLAAKLRMYILYREEEVVVILDEFACSESIENDSAAATRNAIVRAAGEFAKATKEQP